jgi:hypothetical protein
MARRPIVKSERIFAPAPNRSARHHNGLCEGSWILLAARKRVVGKGDIGADEQVAFDQAVGIYVAVGTDVGTREEDVEWPEFFVEAEVLRLHIG